MGNFTATSSSGNLAGSLYSASEARMSLFSGGSSDADASLRYFVNGGALGSAYSEIGQNNSYSSNAYSGGAIAFLIHVVELLLFVFYKSKRC